MNHTSDHPKGVGAAIPANTIFAILLALAIGAAGFYFYHEASTDDRHGPLVIATGPESGTYQAMGKALKRVLEDTGHFESVELRATDGSVDNMTLIGIKGGPVDFAFIQEDVSPTTNARLITSLYDEVLHIMTTTAAAESIHTIYDLEDKRVSLGGAGSGTRGLAQRVLRHFGVSVEQDLVLDPLQTADALSNNEIDAAFLLTAIPSDLVSGLAQRDRVRFISLGEVASQGDEAHALERVFPGVRQDIIPRSTYVRFPREPVHTVGVAAMLVARADLDEELVRDVTSTIFEHRSGASGLEGTSLSLARRIREHYDPSSVTIPFHSGAAAYYRREEPPFLVEYAETLSFVVTVMLGLYSLSIALRQWLRRRLKNRVDAYLLEVERLAGGMSSLDPGKLFERRDALMELRRTAFDDLIAERLSADESFVILQNHLRDELAAIDARIAELDKGGARR